MHVALVTDGAACLPAEEAAAAGVRVLPLHVLVGDRRGARSREITPGEVVDLLRQGREKVSTSRVSPGELETVYRELAHEPGCVGVVSAHLSGGVSGTVDAARLAAEALATHPDPSLDIELEVEVVDSRTVGLALGWAVQDGAELGRSGADLAAVAALVRERVARSRAWFYVDSLEHLRRGGRLGRAQALLGSALAIKPLLTIEDGEVAVAEKVRTRAKALARLVDLAAEVCDDAEARGVRVSVAVHELGAREAAAELAETVTARTGRTPVVTALDPSLGVHTGPGTLGLVVAERGPLSTG